MVPFTEIYFQFDFGIHTPVHRGNALAIISHQHHTAKTLGLLHTYTRTHMHTSTRTYTHTHTQTCQRPIAVHTHHFPSHCALRREQKNTFYITNYQLPKACRLSLVKGDTNLTKGRSFLNTLQFKFKYLLNLDVNLGVNLDVSHTQQACNGTDQVIVV